MTLADGISGTAWDFAAVRFVIPDNDYFAALRDRSPVNGTFASTQDAAVGELADGAEAIVGTVEGEYYGELSQNHWRKSNGFFWHDERLPSLS
jgi:hypothetical protein